MLHSFASRINRVFAVAAAFAAVVVVQSGCVSAADANEKACDRKPLKVLMIGNSFSKCVLAEMPGVCRDLGLKLDLCSLFIGGCPLETHVSNLTANVKRYHVTWNYCGRTDRGAVPFGDILDDAQAGSGAKRNLLRSMIAADRWDVVTIQQASPCSWRPDTYEPYGSQLIAAVRELAPQARIYVQQTWSYTPICPRLKKWGIDERAMYRDIVAAYAGFAGRHGLPLIRTGEAIDRFRRELPVVFKPNEASLDDLVGNGVSVEIGGTEPKVKGDTTHLNKRGQFMQALVWTATLFGADVRKSAYLPEYMEKIPAEAALMRRIAFEVSNAEAGF